jgi:putative solute:sodium symporter small subunit
MADKSSANAYWAANKKIITISLVIWFLCSFGFGIILRPLISGIAIGGTDLGFWFAQQGSILVFILLIFNYARYMNSLDREHGVDEQ